MSEEAKTVVSTMPCDDEGECSKNCQCNEEGVQCDCLCSEEGDVCDHGAEPKSEN